MNAFTFKKLETTITNLYGQEPKPGDELYVCRKIQDKNGAVCRSLCLIADEKQYPEDRIAILNAKGENTHIMHIYTSNTSALKITFSVGVDRKKFADNLRGFWFAVHEYLRDEYGWDLHNNRPISN